MKLKRAKQTQEVNPQTVNGFDAEWSEEWTALSPSIHT